MAVFITVHSALVHSGHIHDDSPVDHHIDLSPQGFSAVLTVISYCSLSFICHFNLLPLQKELRGTPSTKKLYAIVMGSLLMAYAIYNVVIFSAYFNVSGGVVREIPRIVVYNLLSVGVVYRRGCSHNADNRL